MFSEMNYIIHATLNYPADADSGVPVGDSICWSGWLGLLVLLVVGYLGWKLITSLKQEIDALREKNSDTSARIETLRSELNGLREELALAKRDMLNVSKLQSQRSNNEVVGTRYNENVQVQPAFVHERKIEVPGTGVYVKYATLQSPDNNGVLRFSERTMVDTPNPQKLFMLELDDTTGRGTYRVNQAAVSSITNDLLLFKDFVKPFSFSGDISDATIQDVRPGTLRKANGHWVVEDLLEIKIL